MPVKYSRVSLICFLFCFLSLTIAQAQNKQLTIYDALRNATLQPKNLSGLTWRKGTHSYTWTEKTKRGPVMVQGFVESKTILPDTIIRVADINNELSKLGKGMAALEDLPALTWYNKDALYFTYVQKNTIDSQIVFLFYPGQHKLEILGGMSSPEGDHLDVAPSSKGIAYTAENKLFVTKGGVTGKSIQIGGDETKNDNVVYGQIVHREEFGIDKGTFWSQQGNKLAFYRMDQSMVTDYPIVDLTEKPAKNTPIKYPMAGMKSHHVTLGVLDMATQKIIYLKTTGDPEQYLTNITWSPDEKYIYIAVLNRSQNHMWLNQYDAATGDFIKTLFEETHEKYVEPLNPLYFIPGKNNEFLWLSQRDGWMHFYRYNTDGKMLGQVTKGNWVVTDFLGFDESGKTLYFNATKESPLQINGYSVPVKGGSVKRLTGDDGVHVVKVSDDGKFIIDNYSSNLLPHQINIVNAGTGRAFRTILAVENPLSEYALGETKVFSIKSNDGTDLYCRLITPPNMDKTKKYPVIVYVYGGPHAQMVTGGWLNGSNLWMQYLAQQGYVVFTLDNRGSKNRGRAFEHAIFRNVGTIELDDQMAGVEYLRGLPFVDTARMGVHGWSYGGFMTTSLMLKHPGVFKVAVAGGPVIDWKYYEVMYTERYMDTPLENPAGYWNADLTNHVKNLNGRLLLIHGTSDPTVVWQHSLMFVKKCVDEGKQVDYMPYPGHLHNVTGPDRVHLLTKVTQYFDDFLK